MVTRSRARTSTTSKDSRESDVVPVVGSILNTTSYKG
jgi:hypothetical protein